MTLQDYIDKEEDFNQKSQELAEVKGKEFECGFATGIAVLLGDIKKKEN